MTDTRVLYTIVEPLPGSTEVKSILATYSQDAAMNMMKVNANYKAYASLSVRSWKKPEMDESETRG